MVSLNAIALKKIMEINTWFLLLQANTKKVLTKYTELWDKIKYLIKTINRGEYNSIEAGEYRKDFMKIKLNSDENLPLNKILKLHMLAVIARYVFEEDCKYYPEVFLGERLHEV